MKCKNYHSNVTISIQEINELNMLDFTKCNICIMLLSWNQSSCRFTMRSMMIQDSGYRPHRTGVWPCTSSDLREPSGAAESADRYRSRRSVKPLRSDWQHKPSSRLQLRLCFASSASALPCPFVIIRAAALFVHQVMARLLQLRRQCCDLLLCSFESAVRHALLHVRVFQLFS